MQACGEAGRLATFMPFVCAPPCISQVWDRHVFGVTTDPSHPDNENYSRWLAGAGLDIDTCKTLVNPGFRDPWDPR